jgi:hypothetical protein
MADLGAQKGPLRSSPVRRATVTVPYYRDQAWIGRQTSLVPHQFGGLSLREVSRSQHLFGKWRDG